MSDINTQKNRVNSIDVLRGFDMLMIIFADQFFLNLHKGANIPFTGWLANQFDHPQWYGFHIYDIIMPLFLFIVGAVIPFSLSRRINLKDAKIPLYKHLIRRFVILFILGWVVQGRLLHLDINEFQFFSNTLQAIAVGYLFSYLAYMHLNKNLRYLLFIMCLIIYALLITLPVVPGKGTSVLQPDLNFALYFDQLIMGRWDDGLQYTWLLTGFGFTATTLSGLFAGEIIKSSKKPSKTIQLLIIAGIAGIALGLFWNIWHPIVKKIWTSSFVLFTSGICFLLMAFFYWIIDIKKFTNWAFFLKVIGMNSIFAYVVSHVFSFPKIAHSVTFGLEKYIGSYYTMITVIAGFGLLYTLLWYMYKHKIFIKI